MTTETLTESFCERCGTRYEFSAPTRLNPLRKTRGLIGGLKNYITSQDALSDAINDAMRDQEGALATAQLDAFHEAFNFCIDCRQYTCVSCWNEPAGRCRSCAPIPGQDDLAERIAAATGRPVPRMVEATDAELAGAVGSEAWPTHDLPLEAVPDLNGQVDEDAWATTPGTWAATPSVDATSEATPAPGGGFIGVDGFVYETQEQADKVAAQLQAAAEAQAAAQAAEAEAAAAAAAATAAQAEALAATMGEAPAVEPVAGEAEEPRLRVVAWDEDATVALEPEPIVAEGVEPEPEPVAGWVTTPTWPPFTAEDEAPAAEVEVEPVAAEAEPEPEPIAAEAEPEPVAAAEAEPAAEPPTPLTTRIAPISETILHFPERPAQPEAQPLAAQDDSPEAAARRAQLDMLGLGDPGEGALAPDRAVLPYRSRGAAATPAELAMLAAAGRRFWEASAREVASAVGGVGVQNCGECGLSLSANARFCRRCGTRQAQSA